MGLSCGLRINEITALVNAVEKSQIYLSWVSSNEKAARLKPIKDAVMSV
jgi:hypothetical protein